MTIEITRLDLSAAELRAQAARAEEPNVSCRLLATGLILDGRSRHDAAQACAMDRQTLRGWVHRYNEAGPEGLRNRPRRNGPLPRLGKAQQATVVEWALPS